MLKAFDPKALAGHPAAVPALLIACFFGFSYRFFLAEAYLPVHDTADIFHVFKTTYANFAATGEIPEWLPYGVYGYATHLQNLLGLSPLSYPVMAVGKLFGAADTLVLFKTVILLEIAVFSFGFLRLADELFENRAVSLMALAPLLMTTTVINQIYFSFRLVYLLPLLTFFILVFFRTGRGGHAVMAAVVFFASLYGNLFYFTLYYALYVGLLSGLLFYIYRKDFRPVIDPVIEGVPAAVLLAALGLAVLFIGVGVHLVLTATDELTFIVTDRDPVTFRVDLDTFLDYGHGGIVKMFEMLLARPLSTFDATFFIPAAALVFAIYALCREREPVFLAFAATFAFFMILAWGRYSPLAYILYYIPGASYFRHLGLTYAVPKMLLCLIAGFGVRHFLAATAGGGDAYQKERRFLAAIAWLGVFALSVVLAAALFVVGNLDKATLRPGLEILSAAGFLATAVAATPAIGRKTLVAAFAGVIVVQGGIYLVLVNALFTDGYEFEPAIKHEVVRARPYAFEETRLPVPAHPRYGVWNAFDPWRYFYQSHTILYGSLGIDPCTPVIPRNMVDNYSPGVDALARHLLGPDGEVGQFGDYYKRDPDALFFRLAGCDPTAKLQLIGTFEEQALGPGPPITPEVMASAVMVERPDSGERRLVKVTAGEFPGAASLSGQGLAVTHFSANRLEVTVGAVGPKGAWLVYADAFHPGWRAAVDGRPAPVWRANLAFKAVFLPPGTTAVGFDFTHPWRQAAYWFVALFSLAAMVLGCLPGAAHAFRPRRPGA